MTGLPNTITNAGAVNNYTYKLSYGGISGYRTGAAQSIRKWEVLILFAEKFNEIPFFAGSCGLCKQYAACVGCPLYVNVSCDNTEIWDALTEASSEEDVSRWIVIAKEFKAWIEKRTAKEKHNA